MIPLFVDLETLWRGGQSQALLALRGLRARGHPAELLAVQGALAARARAEGIPTYTVSGRAARWRAARLLRRLLAEHRFDVVHANEPHALTAAWLAGAHRRIPLVASRRIALPLQQNFISLARYRAARRIVAISRFVAESVIASGLPRERVEVVYDGVEMPAPPSPEARRQARHLWGAAENEILLGCVGYLLPEKGQDFLIRGMPTVRAEFPGCRLVLAGEGPWRERLQRLVQELGLTSAVHFAGFVEDVSQLYAALDVFIFPSLAEPLGSSLLTAMAHGLPVVAMASGGVPEIVEDGRTGLLISAPDVASYADAFAAGISRLLHEPELSLRLGQAARAIVQQRFWAKKMVEETLGVYARLGIA